MVNKLIKRIVMGIIKGTIYGIIEALVFVIIPVMVIGRILPMQALKIPFGDVYGASYAALTLFIAISIVEFIVENTPLEYVVRGVLVAVGFSIMYIFLNGGIFIISMEIGDYIVTARIDLSIVLWVYGIFFVLLSLIYIVAEASAGLAESSEKLYKNE